MINRLSRDKETIGSVSKYHDHNTVFILLAGGINLDGEREYNFTAAQQDSLEVLIGLLKESYPKAKVIPSKKLALKSTTDPKLI